MQSPIFRVSFQTIWSSLHVTFASCSSRMVRLPNNQWIEGGFFFSRIISRGSVMLVVWIPGSIFPVIILADWRIGRSIGFSMLIWSFGLYHNRICGSPVYKYRLHAREVANAAWPPQHAYHVRPKIIESVRTAKSQKYQYPYQFQAAFSFFLISRKM